MKKDAKYKVVDIFAGGGGFSLASLQAGLDVVFTVENKKWATETYRNNFYNSSNGASPTLYEKDIQQLNLDALKRIHFSNDSCDILLDRPPCHENRKGHKDVYGRIDSRQPAPTITTACVNPSKGRFVHPTCNHGITVRQAARIQTLPDSFVFSGGLQASGMQVGNAVPILLGKVLIEHLAEYLFSLVDFKELNATSRSALALALA